MSLLTDKLNAAHAELTQSQKVISARALIQPIRSDIIRVNAELQSIADSGSFNIVDTDIIIALVKAWNIIKAAEQAFDSDADIKELLNWTPPKG